MKRFWLVLLSLVLIMSFSTTVFAAEAKFSGDYFIQGWYNKNHSLIDKDSARFTAPGATTTDARDYRGSTAFYTQRLRIGMDIQVAKGLKLSTRFDALERKWMAARKAVPANNGVTSTDNEAENIQFDVAYVTFATPIGTFSAGSNCPVHARGMFGLELSENGVYAPNHGFFYRNAWGGFSVSAMAKKGSETYASHNYGDIGVGTDNDSNTYQVTGQYRWKSGATGAVFGYNMSRTSNFPSNVAGGRKTEIPYMGIWIRNKFGRIFIGDEFGAVPFGKYIQWNEPKLGVYASQVDVDADMAISNMFKVEVDLAPARAGFIFLYSRGDDPNTADKKEGGFRSTLDIDRNYNPCLILWNEDYMAWMGGGTTNNKQTGYLKGNAGTNGVGTWVQNVWMYQVYGGFKVSPKLNIDGSFTYANADKAPTKTGWVSKKYGSELDVTLKYKIYDNLEYMIGAAYLWTGDYFKGTDATVKLSNNYLITHKLTLTF